MVVMCACVWGGGGRGVVGGGGIRTWPWPTFLLAQCQISRNRFQPQTLKFPGNFREICHFVLSERGRT